MGYRKEQKGIKSFIYRKGNERKRKGERSANDAGSAFRITRALVYKCDRDIVWFLSWAVVGSHKRGTQHEAIVGQGIHGQRAYSTSVHTTTQN